MNNPLGLYILDGHQPVACPNVLKWAAWHEDANRQVALNEISSTISVSTIFLGIDHGFRRGRPLLFETMIFGGPYDKQQWRYHTWEEAEAGHLRAFHLAHDVALH